MILREKTAYLAASKARHVVVGVIGRFDA